MKIKSLVALACTCILLIACGGGGGGNLGTIPDVTGGGTGGSPVTSTGVSASTFASVDSFIAYVRGLAADDTSEPLTLPDVAAPTTETAEPAA